MGSWCLLFYENRGLPLAVSTPYTERNFMNTDIGLLIETALTTKIKETLNSGSGVPELPSDYVFTDNLGEVIEKLCILHIRTWFLEDMIGVAKTDEEVAALKRKIDTCFKQKRPQYIQAINRMVDAAVLNGRSLTEDSVKIYKGNME